MRRSLGRLSGTPRARIALQEAAPRIPDGILAGPAPRRHRTGAPSAPVDYWNGEFDTFDLTQALKPS
jgi:hypothetical protein